MAAALMMMGMGMSSCSNNDEITEVEQAPEKVQLTLTASFDMGGETRAVWDADGVTPKFASNDKVGVYSDANPSVTPLEVVFDNGKAIITGMVVPSATYHLVFPYKYNTTYDSGTKKISGFDTFRSNSDMYPKYALHYAMTNGSETEVTFKPLCAILKGAGNVESTNQIGIKSSISSNPKITVDGEGGATVEAELQTNSDPFKKFVSLLTNTGNIITYRPVAPGEVELIKGDTNGQTKKATVVAGKIYTVAP